MPKIPAVLAAVLLASSCAAFAQEADAARRERMDAAYADSHRAPRSAGSTLREDTHRAGHAIHEGARATGHAIHNGARATGHAIHRGVRATGHAIHRGADKVMGR
jgi:hypothetical protein